MLADLSALIAQVFLLMLSVLGVCWQDPIEDYGKDSSRVSMLMVQVECRTCSSRLQRNKRPWPQIGHGQSCMASDSQSSMLLDPLLGDPKRLPAASISASQLQELDNVIKMGMLLYLGLPSSP